MAICVAAQRQANDAQAKQTNKQRLNQIEN